MAKRYVYKTGKDSDGDITKLCNENAAWSPRLKAGAISDIELAHTNTGSRGSPVRRRSLS